MIKRFEPNLSTKILASFFVAMLLCFAFLVYKVDSIFQDSSLKAERAKAKLLLENAAFDASVSLYLGFTNEAAERVKELLRNKETLSVRLISPNGVVLAKFENESATKDSIKNAIKIDKEIVDTLNGKLLGSIEMEYSNDNYKLLVENFRTAMYKIAIVAMLALAFTLLFVRKLLRPLGIIADKMRYYMPGRRISFNIEDGNTEIGQIVSAFNKMQENINYYNLQLTNINQNLEHKVKEKTAELRHNYYYDRMTKLPKRVKLSEDLEGGAFSLAILNIDAFKEINDFYGYAAGDEILRGVANWITSAGYAAYRLSGDEFAILFDSSLDDATLLVMTEKLLTDLHNASFYYEAEEIHVGATCGVCAWQADILNKTDIALHHAKENKRRVAIYSKELKIEEKYRKNMEISAVIKDALSAGRVAVYYQPIVDTFTQKIIKYEALMRIIDKNGKALPPAEFLAIAQKGRLYAELTKRVSKIVCEEFKNREEAVTLNISVADILNPSTAATLLTNVRESGIGDRVVFEILESEGIENLSEVSAFISEAKKLGVKIAVDDFGSGYSNFENILKLNVDYIKIDGSLIRQINDSFAARAIVESIVGFSKKLSISLVAEFVCDEAIYEKVREMGIEASQGYYFGKPKAFSM